MRIFLTGFMAAGKTTVGRELAALLGARFVDLDEVIEEREGVSIHHLFARRGEAAFRRLERRALARVTRATGDPLVVATGGGTMTDAANRRRMSESGLVVWLDPDFEVLSERLASAASDQRPLFRDREQARRLLDQRREAYGHADLRLEIAAGEEPHEVASRILERLDDPRCAT